MRRSVRRVPALVGPCALCALVVSVAGHLGAREKPVVGLCSAGPWPSPVGARAPASSPRPTPRSLGPTHASRGARAESSKLYYIASTPDGGLKQRLVEALGRAGVACGWSVVNSTGNAGVFVAARDWVRARAVLTRFAPRHHARNVLIFRRMGQANALR